MQFKWSCLLLLILGLAGKDLQAQQELSLHFMRNIWQANKTNPSFMTEHQTHYGLPNLYFNLSHSGPTYNDVITVNESGEDAIDVGLFIANLSNDNQLMSNLELETTSFSFGIKNVRFSVNHAIKVNTFTDYPKELVELAWNGNAPFIGETIDFGPDVQMMAYNEMGLGAAMKIAGVSAGARIKVLTGIGDVSTSSTEASLYTDPDIYQLDFSTNYRINTSSFFQYNGNGDFEIDFGEWSVDRIFTQNLGLALDLGANFKLGKVEVAASVVDLGAIKWKNGVRNYTSQGDYSYDGLDISNIVRDEEVSFSEAIDTFNNIFEFKETSESYTTTLPTKVYLSGGLELNKMWKVGGLLYSEFYRGKVYPAFALNANAKVGKLLSVGAVYSVRNETYTNLGLNLVLKLGPVQIFGVTDNIITVFQPYDSHNVNARVGLNLAFK